VPHTTEVLLATEPEPPRSVVRALQAPDNEYVSLKKKGLYKKPFAGEITEFTGIPDPYPAAPELHIKTNEEEAHESARRVVEKLAELRQPPCAPSRSFSGREWPYPHPLSGFWLASSGPHGVGGGLLIHAGLAADRRHRGVSNFSGRGDPLHSYILLSRG
jgi:hypothetical protein